MDREKDENMMVRHIERFCYLVGSQLLRVDVKREIIMSVLYGIGTMNKHQRLVVISGTKKFLFWDLLARALCAVVL